MAGLINLELFADFFNKIDPSRKSEPTAPSVELAGSVALKTPRSAWPAIATDPGSLRPDRIVIGGDFKL
jgi:hypothetical protein